MPKYQIRVINSKDMFTTYDLTADNIEAAETRVKGMSTQQPLPIVLIVSDGYARYENGKITDQKNTPLKDEPIG